MARILNLNGSIWVADMIWRDYGERPSAHRLRADGRAAHASHYARYPQRSHSAAFITISRAHARRGLNSLAIATAAALKAQAYAEFDMGGGDLWVIATDQDGELLPGSDQFYDSDTIENLRKTLAGVPFTSREVIAEADLEKWFARLDPAPVTLHPVSLGAIYATLVAIGLIGGGAAFAWTLYSAHEAERLAREAREAARQAKVAPVIPASGPTEIVTACMQAISEQKPFRHGWALQSLQCDQTGLNTHWTRVGGTLSDAPAGHIADNADGTEFTAAIHPLPGRAGKPREGDPIRLFVGFLQKAGVSPVISQGKAPTVTANVVRFISVRFLWTTNPLAIDWNSYAHLSQVTLRRTVMSQTLESSDNGYDVTAVFAVTGATP